MKLLSCPVPTLWQQRAVKKNFQEKELPYFFDQTTRCTFVRSYYLRQFRKPADINDGWIRYVRAIQRWLLDAGRSSSHHFGICKTWVVAAAATVYQEPHFYRGEGQAGTLFGPSKFSRDDYLGCYGMLLDFRRQIVVYNNELLKVFYLWLLIPPLSHD